MNIKIDIDSWYQKLQASLHKNNTQKKTLVKKQTENILNLQKNLIKCQSALDDLVTSISTMESYFCYSQPVLNKSTQTLTYLLIQQIGLKIDTHNIFHKIYARDLPRITEKLHQKLDLFLDNTPFSLFIFRHLENNNSLFTDIAPSSIAKYFLFDVAKHTELEFNIVFGLQKTFLLPETQTKLNWMNQVIKNYTISFFNYPNRFFNFELFQECYRQNIKKETLMYEKIKVMLDILKFRLKDYLTINDIWNLTTQEKIYTYLNSDPEIINLSQQPLVKKWLQLHQKLQQEDNISEQINMLKHKNKKLVDKIEKQYTSTLNLQRRNSRLQNFSLKPKTNSALDINTKTDDSLSKIISDKNDLLLKLNVTQFSGKEKLNNNLKRIEKLKTEIQNRDGILKFRYQNEIKKLENENDKIRRDDLGIKQDIKEEVTLIEKFNILRKSNLLDNSTLNETLLHHKNKKKQENILIQKTHVTAFKFSQTYKTFYRNNLEKIKLLETQKKSIEENKKEIQFEIDNLRSQIVKDKKISDEKLDSVLIYFITHLDYQELLTINEELKVLNIFRKTLESKEYQIMMDDDKLERNILDFINKENTDDLETSITFTYQNFEYTIDIVKILVFILKFQYFFLNLEIIKTKFPNQENMYSEINFQKVESNIFNMETKLNPIFSQIKKFTFDNKKTDILRSFFKDNRIILNEYTKINRELYFINSIIQNIEGKNKKIKNLENIILNN